MRDFFRSSLPFPFFLLLAFFCLFSFLLLCLFSTLRPQERTRTRTCPVPSRSWDAEAAGRPGCQPLLDQGWTRHWRRGCGASTNFYEYFNAPNLISSHIYVQTTLGLFFCFWKEIKNFLKYIFWDDARSIGNQSEIVALRKKFADSAYTWLVNFT